VYHQADEPGTDTSWAQPDRLWLNDGQGRFAAESWPGDEPGVSRALAVGDLDGDGVDDLLILPLTGRPRIWVGTADPARVLRVALEGPPGNPDGVGTRIIVRDALGERRAWVRTGAGFQAASDPRPVFAWRGPASIELVFPNGATTTLPVDAPGLVRVEVPEP
jgi:hypothetical protein